MGTSEVKAQYFGQAQSRFICHRNRLTFSFSAFAVSPHKLDSLAPHYLPVPKLFFPFSLLCLSVSQSLPIISLPLFL